MFVSGVQQSDSVIHIHVSILFQILFPFRLLHNIEQSSLCYRVGPYWLCILNIAVYTRLPTFLINVCLPKFLSIISVTKISTYKCFDKCLPGNGFSAG